MNYSIRPMKGTELLYAYPQAVQISAQTGCIGELTGSIDADGEALLTNWRDVISRNKTDGFKSELDQILADLRVTGGTYSFLQNRWMLFVFCSDHPEARIDKTQEFAFRLDTANHSYMLRLNPDKGDTNIDCFCYTKKWLDEHMKQAEKGIRFIDPDYNLRFTIPDGGKITINFSTGDSREYHCRYIDDYHVEVGDFLYHICEFAELMDHNGHEVKPVSKDSVNRDERSR